MVTLTTTITTVEITIITERNPNNSRLILPKKEVKMSLGGPLRRKSSSRILYKDEWEGGKMQRTGNGVTVVSLADLQVTDDEFLGKAQKYLSKFELSTKIEVVDDGKQDAITPPIDNTVHNVAADQAIRHHPSNGEFERVADEWSDLSSELSAMLRHMFDQSRYYCRRSSCFWDSRHPPQQFLFWPLLLEQ